MGWWPCHVLLNPLSGLSLRELDARSAAGENSGGDSLVLALTSLVSMALARQAAHTQPGEQGFFPDGDQRVESRPAQGWVATDVCSPGLRRVPGGVAIWSLADGHFLPKPRTLISWTSGQAVASLGETLCLWDEGRALEATSSGLSVWASGVHSKVRCVPHLAPPEES